MANAAYTVPPMVTRVVPPRIHVAGLSKTFTSTKVPREVLLDVVPGGLVGHNGCGKSTLVKILTGHHQSEQRRLGGWWRER